MPIPFEKNQLPRLKLQNAICYINKAIKEVTGIVDEETWQMLEQCNINMPTKHDEYVKIMLDEKSNDNAKC